MKVFFFFNDTATTEIYTLSLHDALPIYGAVSKEVVVNMVKNLIKITKADIGIAVSGIAGPTGGTTEKPVGTVHHAIMLQNRIMHSKIIHTGNRNNIRIQSTINCFNMIIKNL